MALYTMHLRDGTEKLVDANPKDFPSLETLRVAMIMAARDLLARDAGNGNLDFRFRLDAEDASGTIVWSVRLQPAWQELLPLVEAG